MIDIRNKKFKFKHTPLFRFLKEKQEQGRVTGICLGNSVLEIDLKSFPVEKVVTKLAAKGVFSPETMAERALEGIDFQQEAKELEIEPSQLIAVYQAAIDRLEPEKKLALEKIITEPKGKGCLDLDDPDYEQIWKKLKLDEIRVLTLDEIEELVKWPGGGILMPVPFGPTNAVDHRKTLGPARNQNPRGTCTAFGATVVPESLEYLRDRRDGHQDFAEELIFWYSKWGQIYTAGGYGCGSALRHYTEYGACEEKYFPYWQMQINSNHAHVPAPDDAMDRAHFYTQDEVVGLAVGDVDAVKSVLRSGRCVTFSSCVHGWRTGTGIVEFPDPLDSKERGGCHCTAIIGYIDRSDLPEHFEGGYFIVRNSWGGANSTTHLMGSEYGGHLLMPYGYYRRYSSSCYTLLDKDHLSDIGRRWLAEYYRNDSLRGIPEYFPTDSLDWLFETEGTVYEADIDEINYNWGDRGPFFLDSKVSFIPDMSLGPEDYFSARYSQIRRFRPGWYKFTLRGDDGIRLWVDDRLVINRWKPQASTTYTAEHYLTGGDHVLRVEYYERTGVASVSLNVEPVIFHYEIYDNLGFSGSPDSVFDDSSNDLEWRHASPIVTDNGHFSLRATGNKYFRAGNYRFHAQHTGGCKIWIDSVMVLDDWDGTNPNGASVTISEGTHELKVEYKNLTTYLAPGEIGYYRAALLFDWSEDAWQISFYDDQKRKDIHDAGYSNLDSLHEAFRIHGLSGDPVFEYAYPADHNVGGEYYARDTLPICLEFNELEKFKSGIPGSGPIPNDWLGAYIRRKIYIPEKGRYVLTLQSDDGYRLIVDGKQILQDHHVIGADQFNHEMELEPGVHDIAIEYTNTRWDGKVMFKIEKAAWTVDYYDGIDFDSFVQTRTVNAVSDIVTERPDAVGSSNYSLRAKRTIWLPLGRYRVQVKSDDGVRLKIAGRPAIDAWTDQPPTSYWTHFKHRGGNVPIELEFYRKYGGAELEFEIIPDGFFGEYYHGITLQKPGSGSLLDRNVPIAYRFEPAIDFDWGKSGRLARIGANEFSARWSGKVDLPVGRWSIEVTADDGVRLFLDGRLLIDQWKDQAATEHKKTIDLVGREHYLQLEYYEKGGNAVCRLRFKRIF
jgi:hypothetical protein